MSTVETGRGVEGWPIHGRRAPRTTTPVDAETKLREFEEAQEASDLVYAANRVVGLTDISDATVRRVLEGLAKL